MGQDPMNVLVTYQDPSQTNDCTINKSQAIQC